MIAPNHSEEWHHADVVFLARLQRDGDTHRAARGRRGVRGEAAIPERSSLTRISGDQCRGQSTDSGDRRATVDRGCGNTVVSGAAVSWRRTFAAAGRYRG